MKPLCEVAISAWEEIAAHLREEAAWRAGCNGTEPASRYKASNSDKQFVLLEADFTVWEAMRNSVGEVYGQREHGDVFEQCEEMVEAGHNALESLLGRAGDDAGPMAHESSWPLGGGWREGCHVRLNLRDFRGSFDDVEPLREQQFPAHLKQGSQSDPNKEYLGYVLGRVMAGYEVKSVLESGHDPSHDLDLLESTGTAVARVECVSLTSRTGEHWLNTKKQLPQKIAKKLRFNWEARLSLSGPSENKWKVLNADPGERKSRYEEFRDKLVKRIIWAESQMDTAVGACSLANARRLGMEDPEHEDLARVWLTAEESGRDSGGLSIRTDGSSHGPVWSNEGEHLEMAVEHVNSVIAKKSESDQAGAYTEPKWLLVAIDTLWLRGVSEVLEACLSNPLQLADFANKVDLGIFDKVWLTWEMFALQEGAEPQEQATSVVVLTQDSPPLHFAIYGFRLSPASP